MIKVKPWMRAIASAAILTAISASAAHAATELKVWCWDDKFNVPAARMAAERFTAKHPDVTVKVESIAQDNTIQKMNAALGANNLRGLPDIVLIEDYRSKNFAIGYPDFLKDLKSYIDFAPRTGSRSVTTLPSSPNNTCIRLCLLIGHLVHLHLGLILLCVNLILPFWC